MIPPTGRHLTNPVIFSSLLATLLLGVILVGGMYAQPERNRKVAVTFDDLPASGGAVTLQEYRYINTNLLAGLERQKIPAIGFVNESKLFVKGEIDERTEILSRWLVAGHQLGNHTYSHIPINSSTFEDYIEDLIRGETVTRMLLKERGEVLRYYRHTQLRTGPTEEYRKRLNAFLAKRGYTVAPVTIDNNEYVYAIIYARAKAGGDKELSAKIALSYLEYMEEVFTHFESLSQDFLEREVNQILLLHANELNADLIDRLAEMMRGRGYEFIKLEDALRDPAYELPEVQSNRGLSWIHRWMLAKGHSMRAEPREPEWVSRLLSEGG